MSRRRILNDFASSNDVKDTSLNGLVNRNKASTQKMPMPRTNANNNMVYNDSQVVSGEQVMIGPGGTPM